MTELEHLTRLLVLGRSAEVMACLRQLELVLVEKQIAQVFLVYFGQHVRNSLPRPTEDPGVASARWFRELCEEDDERLHFLTLEQPEAEVRALHHVLAEQRRFVTRTLGQLNRALGAWVHAAGWSAGPASDPSDACVSAATRLLFASHQEKTASVVLELLFCLRVGAAMATRRNEHLATEWLAKVLSPLGDPHQHEATLRDCLAQLRGELHARGFLS